MADTIVEINATAEQLEAAAKADHWNAAELLERTISMYGGIFFLDRRIPDSSFFAVYLGVEPFFEYYGSFNVTGADGSTKTIYAYRRIKKPELAG